MDWAKAIERNREDLLVIVARLFVLTGIRTGRMLVAALPRGLRIRVLAILRPAEFAARRLVMIAASTLTVPPLRERAAATSGVHQRVPDSGLPLTKEETDSGLPLTKEKTHCGLPLTKDKPSELKGGADQGPASDEPAGEELKGGTERTPAFTLFDPFKPFGSPWLTEEQIARLENPDAWRPIPAPQLPPDEPVGAHSLCRRIHALHNALEDLEGHALRLARWRARRHLDTSRPRRWTPMRPGRPPGWRKRPKTAIEEVLKECHSLALYALQRGPPATSPG